MITTEIWIPLPDGRRLSAKLWLPDNAETSPCPAILEYLPYRYRDGTSVRDDGNYPVFAKAGYAGVRVDIAGNGDSDGLMVDEYNEDELTSGEEVIKWIAQQTWCNGAVGMIGISWGGFNGLQIAMRRPAALRAIVTVCSTHNRYALDIHYMGGCLLNDNFNWGAQMTGLSCRPPDPQRRDDWRSVWLKRLHRLPHLAADWLHHQRYSAYWKHGSVCEDWQAIQCPVLAIGGWADCYSDAPAILLENLAATTKALVGPWEHRYPSIAKIEPRANFQGEVIRWFDKWLKGIDNGVEQLPAYRVYMQQHDNPSSKMKPQQGHWVAEPTMPVAEPPQPFYLTTNGLSNTAIVTEQTATVASPQHTGLDAGNFCVGIRIDNELANDQQTDDAKSLCFDSDVLQVDLDSIGAPLVNIEFSCNQPYALLALRLCDVAPNGQSQRVSYMTYNLTHHHSPERPVALQANKRYRIAINMRHCAHRFRQGHRLRLALSTSYWPYVWPSPNNASVTLHLQNCQFHLPQRQAKNIDTVAAPLPCTTPILAYDVLKEASENSKTHTLPDGTHEIITQDDMGTTRNPHHGLAIGINVLQKFSIHPRQPLSACAETTWQYIYERDSWKTQVICQQTMTCDQHQFYLQRKVTAYEETTLVFEKTWNDTIARDCC